MQLHVGLTVAAHANEEIDLFFQVSVLNPE